MGKLIRVMIVLAVCACFTTNTRAASIAEDVAKAQALSASGDNKGASAVYESLIASHPDSQGVPVWYCQASRCYWLMDMYEPCFAAREKAIELTSDPRAKRDWQYECADWYYLAGKYDKAISLLGKLISENPKDTNRARWYYLMSLCYRFSKNIDESMKSLDKAVELAVGPHLKRNLREVRAIDYNLNGDHDKAKVEYEKLVKDYPDAPGLAYWNREIASCYWRQNDYPNCFRALRKAIASAKYPEMKRSWEIGCGVRAYQVRDYDTVVSVLTEPAKESSNIDLGRLVGRSYINLRDWEKALSTYQMLDEKSPQHRVEWRLWTAYCYEQQGKYQKAESIYRGLISKYAKDDSVSCTYYRLGRCLVKEGKAKEAQALLDAYYRDGSHKPEAMFWEAAILTVEMQQYKEALPVLNKYLSDYPKHDLVEEANWLMASSLLHTSQLDQAKSVAEALLEREKAGNQVTSDLKIDDDLDMFPETDDKVVAQFVSIDDLVHAPQESLARARYAIGHLCQKEGNCDLAERLMRSVIDQYPNCATAKEARSALDLWQKVGTKNP